MARVALTATQQRAYDFIRWYVREHDGIAPAYSEILEAIGTSSKSVVHRLVGVLEERGLITRLPNRSRTIRLTQDPCMVEVRFSPAEMFEIEEAAKAKHLTAEQFVRYAAVRVSRLTQVAGGPNAPVPRKHGEAPH